jgi:hypothetical protein
MPTRVASSPTVCETPSACINVRPGTNEVWAGDVGWSTWEEINRAVDPGSLENFAGRCYGSQPPVGLGRRQPERVRNRRVRPALRRRLQQQVGRW